MRRVEAELGKWAGDITNHYLLEGFRGGFLTLSLFIAVLAIAFESRSSVACCAGRSIPLSVPALGVVYLSIA